MLANRNVGRIFEKLRDVNEVLPGNGRPTGGRRRVRVENDSAGSSWEIAESWSLVFKRLLFAPDGPLRSDVLLAKRTRFV